MTTSHNVKFEKSLLFHFLWPGNHVGFPSSFGMRKILMNTPTLKQNTHLGLLNLFIYPKEIILLKLYFSPKEQMMGLWKELWEGIPDYDLLPAGCRALMPSVVRKMQLLDLQEDWKHVHGLDLTFLSGLPRFVWTKNKFALNQTLRIAEHLDRSGIEIMAIKGTAELLSGAELGMMRSTADIDLLVRPEDFELFKQKMSELGFNLIDDSNLNSSKKRSPLPNDQYIFKSNGHMMLAVDVHLMVNQYQADDVLTALVWRDKIQSTQLQNLFVPSPRESFLIALINGFRMHNWYNGSYLKYLSDSLTKLDWLYNEHGQDVLQDSDLKSLNLQDWNEQIIRLGQCLREADEQLFTSFKLNPAKVSEVISNSSEKQSKSITVLFSKMLASALPEEEKKTFSILVHFYSNAWKSRNKQGYFIKVIFFLVTDPPIRLLFLLERKAKAFFTKGNSKTTNKALKTPISSVNWI